MIQRRTKRLIRCGVLLVAVAAAIVIFRLSDIALRPTALYSGGLLAVCVLLLTSLNIRKRIRLLPIGSAETWLQVHIYLGLFCGVMFGIHIRWHLPSGGFDWLLAVTMMTVFVSGVVGTIISRVFPKRLTTRGDEVLYQHIPARVVEVQREVEQVVMQCMDRSESSALPEFYLDTLKPFFDRPRNAIHHLLQSERPRTALLTQLGGFRRYLDETQRGAIEQIAEKIIAKDRLDYQYALQSALKIWLFVHVPLTYVVLVFASIHTLQMLAFSGGLR